MSTTLGSSRVRPAVPAAFARLVDDAAIFPPGDAAMADALAAHATHRRRWYADLVGPFVCSDARLPELQQTRERLDEAGPLRISLTVTGGAGAVEPALTWVQRDPGLRLAAVEVAVRGGALGDADLAHNAARITTVLSGALPDDAEAFIELPRLRSSDVPAGWVAALEEVAAAGHLLKYRTGGLDDDAFPPASELATVIDAAIEREVPFKCTAGLHHAVAHLAADTGWEHHGFLNVLLGTRAALDSLDPADVARLLADRDPDSVAARARDAGPEALVGARRWFRSFGSCSVSEPLGDLLGLGLLSRPAETGHTTAPPGGCA
ncbi:MAG TPA: hypothetical protein VFJ14_14565 [Nocardioidaceae bacterium]|nr:hypothetical protein [Nocardioidaceae bacterium]